MSNSRIFCIAFTVWMALSGFAEMLGLETTYQGLLNTVAKFFLGVTIGALAVAIWGDRAIREETHQ